MTIAGQNFISASSTFNNILIGGGFNILSTSTNSNSSVDASTVLGFGALGNATSGASENVAIGFAALQGTSNDNSGNQNTAVGTFALQSNMGGGQNVGVGYGAGIGNTYGVSNVYVGMQAGLGNATGTDNTYVGTQAGWSNSGKENSCFGSGACNGNYTSYFSIGNTAFGYAAGNQLSTNANFNTLIGDRAGETITTGASNIYLGAHGAGTNGITTGNRNIVIGDDAGIMNPTVSNQLNIGNFIFGTGLNGTAANFSTSAQLGIGTSTPSSKLSIFKGYGDSNSTLFSISSSTNAANTTNTTLFAVSNTGVASTTNLAISALLSCAGSSALQTNAVGLVTCGSIAAGGASTGGGWIATGSATQGKIVQATSTYIVALGSATSTPYAQLSVVSGNIATTTLALVAASGQNSNIIDTYDRSGTKSFTVSSSGVVGLNPILNSSSSVITLNGRSFLSATTSSINNVLGGHTFLGLDSGAKTTNGFQNTGFGYQALQNATSSSDNVAIGFQALSGNPIDASGTGNIAIGSSALSSNTNGDGNVGLGYAALLANTSGSFNFAMGGQTLQNNVTGWDNQAIGNFNMFSNVSGNSNLSIGSAALNASVSGNNNVALGFGATGNNRSATNTVAIGVNAGVGASFYSNQGGTAIGYQAGFSFATSSDYNTLIGYQAGYGISSGSNNIVIGTATSSTGVNNLTTGSQNILIGNNIGLPSATANGQLNIANILFGTGNTGTGNLLSTGRIGIGTTTPFAKLSISANNGETNRFLFEVASSTATASSSLFSVANNGQIGIGRQPTIGNGTSLVQIFAQNKNTGVSVVSNTTDSNALFPGFSASYFNNDTGGWSSFLVGTQRGTEGAGTALVAGDVLGSFEFQGGIGSNTQNGAAALQSVAEGNFTGASSPTGFVFSTTPVGSLAYTERMRISSNGNVGIGTTSPWAKLSVIASTTTDYSPAFVIATTSNWNAGGQSPLIIAFATTTGALDFTRVAIGTSTTWGNAGVLDQLTVAGRIYSTWRNFSCDFSQVITTLTGANERVCGPFGFFASDGQITGNTAASNNQGYMILQSGRTTTDAAGEGARLAIPFTFVAASSSPVIETWMQNVANSTSTLIMAGFDNQSNISANMGTEPTAGAYFVASSTSQFWTAVVRNGTSRFAVTTTVASSTLVNGTSSIQKLRVELTPSNARFIINGSVVAVITSSNISMPTVDLTPMVQMGHAVNIAGVAAVLRNRILVNTIRFWMDDPPGEFPSGPSGGAITPDSELAPLSLIDNGDISIAYYSDDVDNVRASSGKLVSLTSSSTATMRLATSTYDTALFGVVSNSSRVSLGAENDKTVRVAKIGRVPVLVTTQNGAIKVGDPITSSDITGYGMKATRPGMIIGHAVEAYDPTQGVGECGFIDIGHTDCAAQVLVDLNVQEALNMQSFASSAVSNLADAMAYLASSTAATVGDMGSIVVGQVTAKVAIVKDFFADKIFANRVETKELCVEDVCVTKAQFLNMVNAASAGAATGNTGGSGDNGGGSGDTGTSTPDTEAPVVSINGNNPTLINVGDTYSDLGASVLDNGTFVLSYTASLDGGPQVDVSSIQLDTSAAGEHTVTYTATDAAGNVGTAIRTVIVNETTLQP